MNNWNLNEIQIVTFAAPYPANYGGVIDVFYKIKTLFEAGVKVHLHAFIYGEHLPSRELERLCTSVHYYRREQHIQYLQGWPYIISTRYHRGLIQKVLQIKKPVVLEGLHSCFLLEDLKKAHLPFVIRMHNVEWKYYQFLAELEPSYIKKKYFLEEARRLKKFEKNLSDQTLLTISENDTLYYQQQCPRARVEYVPAFHAFDEVKVQVGKGEFALFHGNLSVNENEQAVLWLVEKVFSSLEYPLIIAGKNPTQKLMKAIRNFKHIELVQNPSDEKMIQLMEDAQVHLLPNRQPTGIKIKWVNALFTARNIIVHPDIHAATDEEIGIFSTQQPEAYKKYLLTIRDKEFTPDCLELRKAWMNEHYSNITNVNKLLESFRFQEF